MCSEWEIRICMNCSSRHLVFLALALFLSELNAQQVNDTRFEPNRGYYNLPISVIIRTDSPGALISHTTDGSAPQPQGGRPSPVTVIIDHSVALRAIAYDPTGVLQPTNIDTHTYVILSNPIVWSGQSMAPGGNRSRDFSVIGLGGE